MNCILLAAIWRCWLPPPRIACVRACSPATRPAPLIDRLEDKGGSRLALFYYWP